MLMKEQETLDIAHTQVTTLTDSLLGLVDEGSRPQLRDDAQGKVVMNMGGRGGKAPKGGSGGKGGGGK